MWIFKDKRTYPPVIRPFIKAAWDYRQGWRAALTALRDAVQPDAALAQALAAVIDSITAQAPEPGAPPVPNLG